MPIRLKKEYTQLTNHKLWCMPKLMELTGGINDGELITIAARAGCGKTSLALNLLAEASKNWRCLYLSLEMSDREISKRMNKISKTYVNDNIWIEESDSDKIEIEKFIKKKGIKFLFVDYVQLMEGSIKQNTRWLKELALKYHLVVVAMSQLNRLAAEKTPTLEMLSTSDKIAHDSDQVWLITKDKIIVAKNRKGSTGEIWVKFDKPNFSFIEDTSALQLRNTIIQQCNSFVRGERYHCLFAYIDSVKDKITPEFYNELITWAKDMRKNYMKSVAAITALWHMVKF